MKFDIKDVADIRSAIAESNQIYEDAKDELVYCENRCMDIEHELELNDLSYHQIAKLGKELAELRKRRREAKNQIFMIEPFIDWADHHRKAVNDLSVVLGRMRTISEKQKILIYHSKVDPKVIIEHKEM